MPDNTWIQLNFKTPAGSLLNIYAEDGIQLDEGIDALEARLGRIADIERMITATGVVNNAFSQPSVPQQRQAPAQEQWTQQPQAPQQSSAPNGPAPMCAHGPKKWLTGVSKNTGKEYAFWACTGPRGEQCR